MFPSGGPTPKLVAQAESMCQVLYPGPFIPPVNNKCNGLSNKLISLESMVIICVFWALPSELKTERVTSKDPAKGYFAVSVTPLPEVPFPKSQEHP